MRPAKTTRRANLSMMRSRNEDTNGMYTKNFNLVSVPKVKCAAHARDERDAIFRPIVWAHKLKLWMVGAALSHLCMRMRVGMWVGI